MYSMNGFNLFSIKEKKLNILKTVFLKKVRKKNKIQNNRIFEISIAELNFKF